MRLDHIVVRGGAARSPGGVWLALWLGLAVLVQASPASGPPWIVLATSDQGGPETPGERLVTTSDELQSLWKQLHSHIVQGAPEVPKVEIFGHSVVAVWLGQKPSGGHGVTVTGVSGPDADGTLTVRVCTFSPPPDTMSTLAVTSPWVLVLVSGTANRLEVARSTCP